MFKDDAPIFTVYFPPSAIHEELFVLKEARSAVLIVKEIFCEAPGRSKPVFAKALNSLSGLSNLPDGAVTYNSTTSFPATFPAFVIVTVAVIELLKVAELSFKLLYEKLV